MLPKLETPIYSMSLPSTGAKVSFRPFLVNEQKVMMIAQETDDVKQSFDSVKQVIEACTFNKIKCDSLTKFDLESLFLKIRSKSVGETSEILIKCPECEKSNKIVLNLDSVDITVPPTPTIMVNETVGIKLKYPTFGDLTSVSEDPSLSEKILLVIDSIFDEVSVYNAKDYSKAELIEFIDQMPSLVLKEIGEFMGNMPEIKLPYSFTCSCGKHVKDDLSGLGSFF